MNTPVRESALTINPIADAINEIEETVVVTLVAGAGYKLGATTSVPVWPCASWIVQTNLKRPGREAVNCTDCDSPGRIRPMRMPGTPAP